jgi:hypothetical protein
MPGPSPQRPIRAGRAEPVTARRWPRWTAALALGAGLGILGAHQTDITVDAGGAPLVIRPEINTDRHTLDVQTAKAGPICAKIPSDIEIASIPLGLHVTSYQSAEADITAYAALYSDRSDITRAVLWHYGTGAASGAALALAALGLCRLVFGGDQERLRRVRKAVRAATFSGASLLGTVPMGLAIANRIDPALSHAQGDPIFNGSSLEGSSFCGQQLVDKANYAGLATTFASGFADHVGYFGLPQDEDVVPVLLRSDAHCNIGIQDLDLAIAKAYDVQVYATLGDEFSSGRFLNAPYDEEKICVAPFYKSLTSMGVDLVGVAGNHETPAAVAFMRELGMTVLEGQTADVGGVSFFGYGDPVRSNGTGSVPHDSAEQHALNRDTGELVGRAACLDRQRRDIVLTHEYQMALAITEQFDRCGQPVTMVAAGHTHVGHGPYALAGGQTFVIYDSAGGAEKSPKLDWLTRPAVTSVAFVNRQTGALVRQDTVTADPDGSVAIRTVLPSEARAPDPAVIPELAPRPSSS